MRPVLMLLPLSALILSAAAQETPAVASTVDRAISSLEKQILDAAEAMPESKFNFSPESLHIPGAEY